MVEKSKGRGAEPEEGRGPKVYTLRELNQETARVTREVRESGTSAFISRHGRVVAEFIPLSRQVVDKARAKVLAELETPGKNDTSEDAPAQRSKGTKQDRPSVPPGRPPSHRTREAGSGRTQKSTGKEGPARTDRGKEPPQSSPTISK